jgi:hypothetical protein
MRPDESGNGRGSVSINVAVIDDGGPVPHPDLNVRELRHVFKTRGAITPRLIRWAGTARWWAASLQRLTTRLVGSV